MKALARSTSALAMPFSILALCFLFFVLHPSALSAELIDKVIAYVDDRAITLREFNEYYERLARIRDTMRSDMDRTDALNTFINRILLLREARKLRLEAPTEDELLNEYIELKVKAFIRIREEDIKDFYNLNQSEFRNQDYDSVRDQIEEYLIQRELNRLLKRHIDELRANSYIKIL